ncbi:MAG: hypothetical protein SF182_08015 [Deltaproteobacteria bacterium]|nr:hypothetical protein [Deltaproteobacteria bacterium]
MRGRTLSMQCALLGLAGLLLAAGAGASPAAATTANDLCAANADPCVISTVVAVTTGSVLDFGQRELRINTGGALDVSSGTLAITARALTMQAGSFLRARPTSSSSPGGSLTITLAQADLAGTIDASGAPGGAVTMVVSGRLTLTGTLAARATSSLEVGGSIDLTGGEVVISGAVQAFGGNFEGLGGDISVSSTGPITVSGTLDATGADGGTIDLDAGPGAGNAGDLIIAKTAIIKSDATAAGNFGGTIDLAAQGDNLTTGRVFVDGQLTASGRTGGEDTGGGDGGCVSIAASGDIRMLDAAATFNVNAGGPDGSGGEIELSTISGAIEVRGTLTALAPGDQGSGGSVSIDATRDAIVAGPLFAGGGDSGGGEITIASSAAGVTLEKTSSASVAANALGAGGTICVESGSGGAAQERTVVIEGDLTADGGTGGGGIDISGGAAVRVSADAVLSATALTGRGGAVSIAVDSGPALIDGPITVSASRPEAPGGIIAIDASQRIVSNGQLDARGQGMGGSIGLSSGGGVDVRRPALAGSSAGAGGEVEIVSQGQVLVGATLNTDGSTAAGHSTLTGCDVTICGMDHPACPSGGTGMLTSLGPNGVNRIVGRDSSFVLGTMRANTQTGRNELVYNGASEAEPLVLGSVTPEATVIVDAGVRGCPRCGNSATEPPETCDDGNQLDGDGCSAVCQLEAPLPGDANGDYVLSSEDRVFLANEIFDGDGDSVGAVSGGAFAGSPGADANDDSHVTAADLVAIARLLGE